MISAISGVNNWCFQKLEESLLPTQGSTLQKLAKYALQAFKFLVLAPISTLTSTLNFIATRFASKPTDPPLIAFAKNPTWKPVTPNDAAPVPIGFSTAGFQDDGPLGHPETNWGHHYLHTPDGQALGPIAHVPDFWNHPERALEKLNEIGATEFRFSIDRDRLQAAPDAPFNPAALERYREIIRMFRNNGGRPIQLTVTLDHFCKPLYHDWARSEDVPSFVDYAVAVCDMLAEEGVTKIITENEPTVIAFQERVMGKFPPYHKMNFEEAGRVLENMMRAHIEIYHRVKERHPELQIGLSHDPIRFRHFHKWFPGLSQGERLVSHYLTEINHSSLMRYFMTGKFELKVPFRTNYSFETEKPPMDFIGLQYYSDPLLNFLKGSDTRVQGEKLATYQFRMYPQGLASALYEMSQLGIPIDITEVGMDTGVNIDATDAQRIEYFGKIFQVIQKALENGIDVRTCHLWTLRRNLEWYTGKSVDFGFYDFNFDTGEETKRPICDWVAGQIERREGAAQAAG